MTFDALRADHVSAAGYPRPTTPWVDALAARGARYELAYAPSPWTIPSVASLLTSRHLEFHGAHIRRPLEASVPAWPGLLRASGAETAAFVRGAPAAGGGLTDSFESAVVVRDARDGVRRAARWIGARRGRFFVWLHLMETHMPYACPARWRERFSSGPGRAVHELDIEKPTVGRLVSFLEHYNGTAAPGHSLYRYDPRDAARAARLREDPEAVAHFTDHYDGCLSYADAQLAWLERRLRRDGLAGRVAWIVTSDHGEHLGASEGGRPPRIAHPPGDLTEALLRVPLVLAGPGVPAGRVERGPVGHVDLGPTVLELLGAPPLPGAQGRSLLGEPREAAAAFAADLVFEPALGTEAVVRMVRRGDWKWVRETGGGRLYDLSRDPFESRDLLEREPARALELGGLWLDRLVELQQASGPLF